MKYCSICLNPDTRPNTVFPKKNICPACHYYYSTRDIDWDERLSILRELIKTFPKFRRRRFDCIIGVSGGKDSLRQALWIRDKLGLRPLLVCLAYPPQQITERGADNLSNLIKLGFDVHTVFLSPATWQKLTRESFFKFTNYMRHSEQAILSAVPRLAIRYKIPIIFWGENPGLQLGDMKTIGKTGYDGNNLKNMNTVAGGKLDWFLKAGFKKDKLFPFEYPSVKEFKERKIQIIYLGWFWGDWSIVNNGVYSTLDGLKIRTDTLKNTADLHGVFSLDEDWITFNQMIKYFKYGFGRVSDYVNEEIRLGRISREEGIKLAEKYDASFGKKYVKNFCEYISVTEKQFWRQIYKSVNKKLFKIDKNKKIIPKFKVGEGLIK